MKLESLEMIRIITSKFCFQVKDELIKANTFTIILNLFKKHPNNSMMHSKIEEIIIFSLKTGGEEIVEEILYKTQLINYILELTAPGSNEIVFEATNNHITQGYFAHIINISNKLIKLAQDNIEIQSALDSLPEWRKFQEGLLKERNTLLEGDLGGKDPRVKNETPFDDQDFLGRFKGFKPVSFESIQNRRKNLTKRQEEDIEQETEEEEDEDEEKLDFDEINKYFTSNDEEEIDLELDMEKSDLFSSYSQHDSRDLKPSNMMKGRYDTIELDEDDDVDSKGLEWTIDPVTKEGDNEKIIDDAIKEVAMEFIEGQKSRRKHRKNKECFMDSKKIEFDIDDKLLFNLANSEFEEKKVEEIPETVEQSKNVEEKEYYDTNFWKDPYTSQFKIEDLLQE